MFPAQQRPFARQAVLSPADPPPVADLRSTRIVGTQHGHAELSHIGTP